MQFLLVLLICLPGTREAYPRTFPVKTLPFLPKKKMSTQTIKTPQVSTTTNNALVEAKQENSGMLDMLFPTAIASGISITFLRIVLIVITEKGNKMWIYQSKMKSTRNTD
jgi:hypothetical protein